MMPDCPPDLTGLPVGLIFPFKLKYFLLHVANSQFNLCATLPYLTNVNFFMSSYFLTHPFLFFFFFQLCQLPVHRTLPSVQHDSVSVILKSLRSAQTCFSPEWISMSVTVFDSFLLRPVNQKSTHLSGILLPATCVFSVWPPQVSCQLSTICVNWPYRTSTCVCGVCNCMKKLYKREIRHCRRLVVKYLFLATPQSPFPLEQY